MTSVAVCACVHTFACRNDSIHICISQHEGTHSVSVCVCVQVIAVVMDVFTDVDILRDLLDAGYKRRVSVYILLERTTLPHFLSMCQRANMHPGHLKVSQRLRL